MCGVDPGRVVLHLALLPALRSLTPLVVRVAALTAGPEAPPGPGPEAGAALGTAGAPVISYNTVVIGYVNYCNYARLVLAAIAALGLPC